MSQTTLAAMIKLIGGIGLLVMWYIHDGSGLPFTEQLAVVVGAATYMSGSMRQAIKTPDIQPADPEPTLADVVSLLKSLNDKLASPQEES